MRVPLVLLFTELALAYPTIFFLLTNAIYEGNKMNGTFSNNKYIKMILLIIMKGSMQKLLD